MVISDLKRLVRDTHATQSQAFASGTWKNLITQWVKYLSFCSIFGLNAFPACDAVLAWYVQYLSYTFKSHSSIVNYMSGVKTLHNLIGFHIKGFSGFLVKLTVRGLRRISQHQPCQALAINPVILNHMFYTLNMNDPLHVTFWAMCLTSFFLLLRKSNIVVDRLTDPVSQLVHRRDITFNDHEALVTLRWSKTNQFGEHMIFSLPEISGSNLCPVLALKCMYGLVRGEGVCFRRVSGKPMTYYQYHTLLRQSLSAAGYDAERYSSHSMRRGGTTFAFLCGVPSELIRVLGSWRSDCYLRYLEFPMEARAAATQLMKHRIQLMNW